MPKSFFLMLFFAINAVHSSSALQQVSNIGKAAPTALVASFFTFFAVAVPNFAMSAYQAYHNNTVHTDSSSSVVKFLYPFILRVDKNSYTINPTSFSAQEYLSMGLKTNALSISCLFIGWILSKFATSCETIDNVSFGKSALENFSISNDNLNVSIGRDCL